MPTELPVAQPMIGTNTHISAQIIFSCLVPLFFPPP